MITCDFSGILRRYDGAAELLGASTVRKMWGEIQRLV